MNFENAVAWISDHESALSGVAAAIVIGSVLLAILQRLSESFKRSRRSKAMAVESAPDSQSGVRLKQEIRFCTTPDDVRLAYATVGASVGDALPLVRSLGWFTHLEFEWENKSSRTFWEQLAQEREVIRYDGRGMGLSDRDVDEFSLETRLLDLETVVDAAGLDRFALMGFSEGGTTAMAYAAKHPDRVSHLILWGTFLNSATRSDIRQWSALIPLIPEQWGKDSAAFHQLFVSMFLPDGTREHNELLRELQRRSTSGETALKLVISIGQVNVTEEASRIRTPTLVMHRKGDLACPVEGAQAVASQIPGARLELLEGANHWMWMQEESTPQIMAMIDEFLASP